MIGPRPAGQRWTKADDNQLRAMLEAGAKAPEIARKLKRTIMDRRLKMKVKIFERSGEPGRLEREINDFLATLGPGAVLNTQTAIAAVRNENEQIETEYVVTIWYE